MPDMPPADAEPERAAGVIARSPSGRILMCRRTDGEGWAFPGGGIKDGETAERAAWREFWEETGYRLGDVGVQLMRRVKDGVDFTTFISDVDDEFVPALNHEHSSYGWFDPNEVLEEAATVREP
jgi:8-oxo-dGTP pyrophosphatase MutT (NUDIX family)